MIQPFIRRMAEDVGTTAEDRIAVKLIAIGVFHQGGEQPLLSRSPTRTLVPHAQQPGKPKSEQSRLRGGVNSCGCVGC